MLATLLTQYNLDGSLATGVPVAYRDYNDVGLGVFVGHLPRGRHWDAYSVKGTTNYALSAGIGAMVGLWLDLIDYLRRESNPFTTTEWIEEWEKSVGLPDHCTVDRVLTIQQRRDLIVLRLQNEPIVTNEQIEDMIFRLTNYRAKVMARSDPDNRFYDPTMRFVLDVFVDYDNGDDFDGNQDFDGTWQFSGGDYPTIVECVLNRLKPANVIAHVYYSATYYDEVTA